MNDPIESLHWTLNFWKHVDIPPKYDNNVCWEWTSCIQNKGYGYWGPRKLLSHRIAFELFFRREIEHGKVLMHLCDNPKCCNPYHLKEGTQKENIRDASKKGRLTGPPVKHFVPPELLKKVATYEVPLAETARKIGCSFVYLCHRAIAYRNKHGIPHRRLTKGRLTTEEKEFITANFPEKTGYEIGKLLDRPRHTINQFIRKSGLR